MITILKKTFTQFFDDNCSRMAAALAYYTAFSLAPLLILLITLCGIVWSSADVGAMLQSEIKSVVGADGAAQVKTMLDNASRTDRGWIASLTNIALLLVGATGLVGQLQGALNDTWEVQPDPEQGGVWNFITKRILSFGMICGIAFLLLVSLVASSFVSAAGDSIASWLPDGISQALVTSVHVAASLIVISLLFAAMFKFLPDATIAWKDVAVGAVVTAVLFVAGRFAMGEYLGSRNLADSYGAAGSLALILLWIYYSASILLFGAELTQVWATERGSGLKPSPGAIQIEQTKVVVDSTHTE